MDYTILPLTSKEFNSIEEEDRKNYFWCSIYAQYSNDITHYKDDGAWVIEEVNNYYVLAFFISTEKERNDDIFSGTLSKIYACDDFLDFIYTERKDIWDRWIDTSYYIPEDFKLPDNHCYSNYLFVDAPYKGVLEKVSEFFYNDLRMYPIDSDYHTVRSRLIESWDIYSVINSTILYFSADDYNCYGSGILVKIINTHLQIELDHLTQPIPSLIFKKCQNVPHIIEINFNRRWGYANVGYKIMEGLATKFKGNAFMVSSEFHVMEIKANKYLTIEEKIEHLIGSLSNNLSEESMKLTALEVSTLLGDYWDMLTEDSKSFLTTGYFHYHYVLRNQDTLFDTSSPSISFSKVIETEIVAKVILPFKAYFESNYTIHDLENDLKDNNLNKMSRYLVNKAEKPPELGSFAFFIKNAINSKKRAKNSGSIKAFRSFCQTRKNPDFFLDVNNLCAMLIHISSKYRNGSAHIEILPIEYLIEFYSLLFEDKFLRKLLDSSKAFT